MTQTDDDDFLDGCDTSGGTAISDALTPWVVLFADLLDTEARPRSWVAVESRAEEWRALFGTEADRSGDESESSPDPGGQPEKGG